MQDRSTCIVTTVKYWEIVYPLSSQYLEWWPLLCHFSYCKISMAKM